MSVTASLVTGVVLLLGNAFFVGSEFALVSARRTKVEPRAAAGSQMARTTLAAMEDLSSVIAAAQLGVTVCSLGLGAVAEPALAQLVQPVAEPLNLPTEAVHPIAFAFAMMVVVYLHVVLGEMVPKNLALAGPERAAVFFGPPMMVIVTVLRPLVRGLDGVANAFARLLRVEPATEVMSTYTREQVSAMVEESRHEGLIAESEYARLSDALGFTTRTVSEVLLDRDELITIAPHERCTAVEDLCAQTGYSRYPILSPTGDLTGYVHIKDVINVDESDGSLYVKDRWIRPLPTVSATETLLGALDTLASHGAHMGRVVDPEGKLLGLATVEDIIEELVGEIRDSAHHVED